MKRYAVSLTVGFVILAASEVSARPDFLETWKTLYPESRSGDRGCQLCHAQSTGDEPWNTYGFEIRFNYLNIYASSDAAAAIRDTEMNNSDGDLNNLSNIEEINLNLDPGWAPGRVNAHIYKNGDVVRNQPPPFTERDDSFCLPVVTGNSNTVIICL